MNSDALYLCATSRLAQTLRLGDAGEAAIWRTPTALTLGQWQAQFAEEILLGGADDLPPALDADSERLLWEMTLTQTLAGEEAADLFDLPGLAEEAMAAHALTVHWHLPLHGGASTESRAFAVWQSAFLARCQKLGRLTAVDQLRHIVRLLRDGHGILPGRIVLAGFDRLTPLEEKLLAACSERGTVVECSDSARPENGRITCQPCADSLAECHAAVAWAQAHLQATPAARLAIVAPDLASVRARLTALLDEALHPACLRPDGGEVMRAYNVSLGEALAQQPLVTCALTLLQLSGRRSESVTQADLSPLLLGPYWAGDESEADARALGEARLRRKLPASTTWASVFRNLPAAALPRSTHALQTARAGMQAAPRRQLPSQWAATFLAALQAAGWPGERTLTSLEFQAQQAFVFLCGELAHYDALLGPLSLAATLQRLVDLCRRRLFQPQTRGEPNIQVLGVLESAGLQFDALWVMGMNDERWPPPARPNALLSSAAQQAAGCARASAAVELEFARSVQARLLRAAPEVTLSWAASDGNRILRRSPLLALAQAPEQPDAAARVISLAARRAACAALAQEADAKAPVLAAGELLSGGSGVLRAQALCPAWAFYRYRLAASALEVPIDGFDAGLRGTLVHRALEHFWRQTPDQATLLAQDETSRQAALAAAIASALQDFEQEQGMPLPAGFRRLEAARLQRLLTRWLALEAERPAAFTVLACEQKKTLAVGNLNIHVVIDRIDQLADGSLAVLDYKTGPVDGKSWVATRISEPQLPIYAAFGDMPMNTVSFARVALDETGFSGVSALPDQLPKVMAIDNDKNKLYANAGLNDWPALIAHWQKNIGMLADEIEHGVAAVVFASESDLAYCEVLPLLRLAERRRLWQESFGIPKD